ncbi:DUF2917 domain-containing protein [uncultured Piscinibacter sp.]|uniref:DUF2917 domain-containing protein n=1 Tax=uncultured Piscinibacter sp. TaxID=1131835 RepID=UPI0026335C99|nr:DUF2917 domain-containing protein [uncultured Piscinibacter sp.]
MREDTDSARAVGRGYGLELDRDALLYLSAPGAVAIGAEAGLLWITQDGHTQDWLLAPGDAALDARATRLMVSALRPSRLRVWLDERPRHRWSAVLVQADGRRLRLAPERAQGRMGLGGTGS